MNQVDDSARERILSEATRLFAERGVAGASIQAVAEAAGVTRPTLVYHFGSKDGLRRAVILGVLDHWRDELPRLMVAATGKGPRIEGLLGAFFEFFRRDPARARLLLREALDRPDDLAALLREHLQPWTALLSEAVRVGQAAGRVREDVDPVAFPALIIATAVGVVAVGEGAAAIIAPEPSPASLERELVRAASAALNRPRSA